jgi:competence protein ComEA
MSGSARAEHAAFAVALALFGLAWPRPPVRPLPCPQPVAREPGAIVCSPTDTAADAPRLDGPPRRIFGLPLDPNRAAPAALETLPGIGPALAAAIVRERGLRPFESIAGLARVRGLGPLRIRAFRPYLAVSEGLARGPVRSVKSASCRLSCENGNGPDGGACEGAPAVTAEATE